MRRCWRRLRPGRHPRSARARPIRRRSSSPWTMASRGCGDSNALTRSFPRKRESSFFFFWLWVPAFVGTSGKLHNYRQPLRGARDPGVEPALAALGKRKGLIEQHHVVPLRALRLVHGEHVAVIELLVFLAQLPVESVDFAGETL